MEKKKKFMFNYQVVYKINENERIIFTGASSEHIDVLLSECNSRIALPSGGIIIENIVYQPVKNEENHES